MTDAEIIQDALEWAAENGEHSVATKCADALEALKRLGAETEQLRAALVAVHTEGPQELSPEAWALVETALYEHT
jgi:hypothetical protein